MEHKVAWKSRQSKTWQQLRPVTATLMVLVVIFLETTSRGNFGQGWEIWLASVVTDTMRPQMELYQHSTLKMTYSASPWLRGWAHRRQECFIPTVFQPAKQPGGPLLLLCPVVEGNVCSLILLPRTITVARYFVGPSALSIANKQHTGKCGTEAAKPQ